MHSQVICFLLALFKKQGRSDADKQALRAHTRLDNKQDKPLFHLVPYSTHYPIPYYGC